MVISDREEGSSLRSAMLFAGPKGARGSGAHPEASREAELKEAQRDDEAKKMKQGNARLLDF